MRVRPPLWVLFLLYFLLGVLAALAAQTSRRPGAPGPSSPHVAQSVSTAPPAASAAPSSASAAPSPAAPPSIARPSVARPSVPSALPASSAEAVPRRAADFRLPVAGHATAAYGWRRDPVFGDFRFHAGLDLAGRPGEPVLAAAAGEVAEAGRTVGLSAEPSGWEVALRHPGGWSSRYRFAGSLLVGAGERVRQGQPLGRLAGKNLVHFALYRDGSPVEPTAPVQPAE